MTNKTLRLETLVNMEEWQRFQDYFAEALEVTLRTVSADGNLITKTSRQSRLCCEILPKIAGSKSVCGHCVSDNGILRPDVDLRNDSNVKCPFGLDVFTAPISAVAHKNVAYMMMGPLILKERKSIEEYASEAKKTGVDAEEVMDALIEINVFSYNKVYSMLRLIKDLFSHMAQTGYHKKRLGEITPEMLKMDPIFSRYYEKKVLNSLLHSCETVLGADSGSVMTVDKATNLLHIRVATKIDKGIIKKASVKLGEGLSGMAAMSADPIFLPQDGEKMGLTDKMKRGDDIKSSVLLPLNKGSNHEVYGVINLNIARKDADFSEKDIAVVKELVNMASIALTPLYIAPRT